jgi:hypothetical protein
LGIGRQARRQLRQRGIAGLGRHPLHVFVALAGPGRGTAVVKTQAAQGAEQLCQHLKIAQLQRGELLGKIAPRQHQVVQADGKFIQHDGVLRADGAHGQGRVGI